MKIKGLIFFFSIATLMILILSIKSLVGSLIDKCAFITYLEEDFQPDPVKFTQACNIETNLSPENSELVTIDISAGKKNLQTLFFGSQGDEQNSTIPNKLFEIFPSLNCFYILEDQGLERINPEMFYNATNLILFHLNNNNISMLHANVFKEASNLQIINLKYNQIESVHKLAFSSTIKLEKIYLSHNNIKNLLATTFVDLKKLQTLNLSGNACIDMDFNRTQRGKALNIRTVQKEVLKKCKYHLKTNWEGPVYLLSVGVALILVSMVMFCKLYIYCSNKLMLYARQREFKSTNGKTDVEITEMVELRKKDRSIE